MLLESVVNRFTALMITYSVNSLESRPVVDCMFHKIKPKPGCLTKPGQVLFVLKANQTPLTHHKTWLVFLLSRAVLSAKILVAI